MDAIVQSIVLPDRINAEHSNGSLLKYDAACRAIAEAKSTDEVKDIRDKAEAMRAYARQAKNKQLEVDAAEIRMKAERRLGELMQAQRETVGLNEGGRPSKTGSELDPVSKPTLAEAGIDKHLADRARKLAAVPQAQFEAKIGEWRERVQAENERVTIDLLKAGETALTIKNMGSSVSVEYYTPEIYVEAARGVLGSIDLDPASCEVANKVVKAKRFYSAADDGLTQDWHGRIWMNPPYGDAAGQFVAKLAAEYQAGNVSEAICLVANRADTQWFRPLWDCHLCFASPRINFYGDDSRSGSTHGSVFAYFGPNADKFITEFSRFGTVVRRADRLTPAEITADNRASYDVALEEIRQRWTAGDAIR